MWTESTDTSLLDSDDVEAAEIMHCCHLVVARAYVEAAELLREYHRRF